MTSLPEDFWHELRGRYGMLPVWPLGAPMALGDVGQFDETGWTKETTLAQLRIGFQTDPPGPPVDRAYQSGDGAEVATGVAAGAAAGPAGAGGGLRVRFSRQGAFVLRARNTTLLRIADLVDLDRRILDRYRTGEWRKHWAVVTEVCRGGPALVAVAVGRDGALVADLGVEALPVGVPLADATVATRIIDRHGAVATNLTTGPTDLLWRGRYVHDRLFSKPVLEVRGERRVLPEMRPPSEAARVEDIEYPDDLPRPPGA